MSTFAKGLEGIVAAETRMSFIDGEKGILEYVGIPIDALARNSTFEETVFLLWNTRLPTSPQGFPITYAVNGQQFVAVPAGAGGASWSTQIAPDLRPDIRRPAGALRLFRFGATPVQRRGTASPNGRAIPTPPAPRG